MKTRIFLGICLLLLVLSGCSTASKISRMSTTAKISKGNEYYDAGKFRKAIPYYEAVVLERKSSETALAQFRLGDCYFQQEEYSEARFEYEEMIRLFPDFDEIATAYYRIGFCWWELSLSPHYTQDETKQAITAFQTFMEGFPQHEKKPKALEFIRKAQKKLIEKNYWNGYIYYKTWDYSAALLYLNEVIELGNHDKLEMKSLYYAAKVYLYRKDRPNTQATLNLMKTHFPESKETRKIERKFSKLKGL
ncbi:MAG: outer membrane protein assembly factor BamD [Candidatus Cloacimonetes bacterium]|nr:outer membrane protein assembly factor BamD [Candidatus Cloacimonadota bacterium]